MTIKKHKVPFALLNQTWYLRGISNDLKAWSPPENWFRHGGIFIS